MPEPGGVGSPRPQPHSDANLDRGRWENQSAGGSLMGGGRSLRWGGCRHRGAPCVDRKGRNAQCVQRACQTRLQQKWNTESMRLRARQECPAWTWTNHRNDRPIEEQNQRKNLGQMGESETTPCDGRSGAQEDHKCGLSREKIWEG